MWSKHTSRGLQNNLNISDNVNNITGFNLLYDILDPTKCEKN